MVDVVGVTAIETRTTAAGFTFKVAVPLTAPCVAVIVVAPPANEPAPLAVAPVIVANVVFELVQVTEAEISAVLALLNEPVAMNVCAPLLPIVGEAGVTAILCKTGGATVRLNNTNAAGLSTRSARITKLPCVFPATTPTPA